MSAAADHRVLRKILHQAFSYFSDEVDPDSGLVPDKTNEDTASVAGVGLALSTYPIGVERNYLSRKTARHRTLAALRFFRESPQGEKPNAAGYKGFYYHFLDLTSGRRAAKSELSTIDTAILVAGALMAAAYFDRDNADERGAALCTFSARARARWLWCDCEVTHADACATWRRAHRSLSSFHGRVA